MKIFISKGKGEGSTKLSSFDSAIKDAGIYNYNIIHLSSIIPPKTELLVGAKYTADPKEYGHRLYAVLAEIRSEIKGNFIGAGLGWYQYEDGSGVFVEHAAEGKNKNDVEKKLTLDISSSLRDLCLFREKNFSTDKIGSLLSVTKVENTPACVVVVATYKTAGWD